MAIGVPDNPLAAEAPAEGWGGQLAVFAGYLALALVFTWPLALHLGDGVIQRGTLPVDSGQGIWNLWWARTALLQGANPYTTNYLFFPLEIDLFYQTLSLPNALLVAPALPVNPLLAFNLLALLSFALGGFFAYRLGRAVAPGRAAALLAGFVFAFTPYHTQRLWGGSLELIAVQWIPLYVLLLMTALYRRTIGATIAAGLALLLTTLASQYYGLYAVVYTLGHCGLALLLAQGARRRLVTLAISAGIGLVWLAGLLPFIWPLSELGGAAIADWYERQVYHSAAPVDFVLPHVLHPLWGGAALAAQNALHPFGLETGAALGLGIYTLCAVALLRSRRSSWPWLILALLMALLAMGPQLKLGAQASGLPLPFLLLDTLGPFRNSSRPSVFLALMMVPVALLAARGLATLQAGAGGRRIVGLLLGALVLGEALVAPWPIMPLRVDPAYAALAADPQPGAVLELPPRNNDSQYLLNQLCHGRPLVGGYLARLPAYPLLAGDSALARLWAAEALTPDIVARDPAGELAALGVRYLVLDLRRLGRGPLERLHAALDRPGIAPVRSGDGLEFYVIDPQAARPLGILGEGWYALEQSGERRWRWIGDQAALVLPAARAGPLRLSFRATALGSDRPLQIWQNGSLLYETSIPAAPYERRVVISLLLPAGQSTLQLRAPAEQAADGRRLSLSVSELQVEPLPSVSGYQPAARPLPPTLAPERALCGEW